MATKIKTPEDWANALLGALGEPDTKTNVSNLVGWYHLEGGAGPEWGGDNTASYNPLNTSQLLPGSKDDAPGDAIQAYQSWQQGLDATVTTLQDSNPAYDYAPILADLNTSQPWDTFLTALKSSSWDGKGHYSGVAGGTTQLPGTAAPNSTDYDSGVNDTISSGSTANKPSTSTAAVQLGGLAGILQTLDGLYNPVDPSLGWNPIRDLTIIPTDVEHTSIEIFTRAVSSILALGLMLIGIRTFLSGTGASSGGGPSNVLEFVNNAQTTNARTGLSTERLEQQAKKEEDVSQRHVERLADKERDRQTRERVASTPRVSHQYRTSTIKHESSKPKVKVKLVDRKDYVGSAERSAAGRDKNGRVKSNLRPTPNEEGGY